MPRQEAAKTQRKTCEGQERLFITLTAENRARLNAIAVLESRTLREVVEEAVERYYAGLSRADRNLIDMVVTRSQGEPQAKS